MTEVAGLCSAGIFQAALSGIVGTCDGISVAAAVFTGSAVFTTGAAVTATRGSSRFGVGAGVAITAGAAPKVMFRASPDFVT